jgi:hypothetical protein
MGSIPTTIPDFNRNIKGEHMSSKAKKKSVTRSGFRVVEIGDALFIRPAKHKGGKGVHKRMRKRPPTKIPKPSHPQPGCRLTATVYDHVEDTTYFMYECNHAIDNQGHTSYVETRRGYWSGPSVQ